MRQAFFFVACLAPAVAYYSLSFSTLSKPGDGLDQDPIDLSSSAVCHHPLKLRALLDPGAGQSLVSVDVHQLPAVLLADVLCVAANLRHIRVQLIRRIGTDPAVRRHTEAFRPLCPGRDDFYSRHGSLLLFIDLATPKLPQPRRNSQLDPRTANHSSSPG